MLNQVKPAAPLLGHSRAESPLATVEFLRPKALPVAARCRQRGLDLPSCSSYVYHLHNFHYHPHPHHPQPHPHPHHHHHHHHHHHPHHPHLLDLNKNGEGDGRQSQDLGFQLLRKGKLACFPIIKKCQIDSHLQHFLAHWVQKLRPEYFLHTSIQLIRSFDNAAYLAQDYLSWTVSKSYLSFSRAHHPITRLASILRSNSWNVSRSLHISGYSIQPSPILPTIASKNFNKANAKCDKMCIILSQTILFKCQIWLKP